MDEDLLTTPSTVVISPRGLEYASVEKLIDSTKADRVIHITIGESDRYKAHQEAIDSYLQTKYGESFQQDTRVIPWENRTRVNECVGSVMEIIDEVKGEDPEARIFINLTSGNNVLVAALTIACMYTDAELAIAEGQKYAVDLMNVDDEGKPIFSVKSVERSRIVHIAKEQPPSDDSLEGLFCIHQAQTRKGSSVTMSDLTFEMFYYGFIPRAFQLGKKKGQPTDEDLRRTWKEVCERGGTRYDFVMQVCGGKPKYANQNYNRKINDLLKEIGPYGSGWVDTEGHNNQLLSVSDEGHHILAKYRYILKRFSKSTLEPHDFSEYT